MSNQCKCGCGEIVNIGKEYIRGHNSRGRLYRKNLCYEKEYIKKRFESNFKIGELDSCWEWMGSKSVEGLEGSPVVGLVNKKYIPPTDLHIFYMLMKIYQMNY